MSTELLRYNEACRAVAAAKSVDEVLNIGSKADAVRAYARQAKNRQLEFDAAEIRFRAERRLGEMIGEEKLSGNLKASRPPKDGVAGEPVTLADLGVDRKLSSRAQFLAKVNSSTFESLVADWRARVSAEGLRISGNFVREIEKVSAAKGAACKPAARWERFVGMDGRSVADWRIGELDALERRALEQVRWVRAIRGHLSTASLSTVAKVGELINEDVFSSSLQRMSRGGTP